MTLHPLAGQIAPLDVLVDVPALITAYYTLHPDPKEAEQAIAFGTSGHRGSSYKKSFNEDHLLAVTQAICLYRKQAGITGPLFLGRDTHALSYPAWVTVLEVLAANHVEVMHAGQASQTGQECYTPTPVISHAILSYQRRLGGLADGLILTPSHNPPDQGGCKYNPPHGGPAEQEVTDWIQACANNLLAEGMHAIPRISFEEAMMLPTMHLYDYCGSYVEDLGALVDMELMKRADLKIGVDPLGGAGVAYWRRIAKQYGLNMHYLHDQVDPTFAFMSLDHDGVIRMDPSSPYAMQGTLTKRKEYDLILACDTDHDRHGIVTPEGLMPTNHYVTVAVDYLLQHRPLWNDQQSDKKWIGKTFVTSQTVDLVAAKYGHSVRAFPVGFKWFVAGLLNGNCACCCEESAGGTFLRRDGTVWTTEKDGIAMCLLAVEIQAQNGVSLYDLYKQLSAQVGNPSYERKEFPASTAQKKRLKALKADEVTLETLAGQPIIEVTTQAPANQAALGGLYMRSENSWCAVRPSGTEDLYKVYAESFLGQKALEDIFQQLTSWIGKLV